VDTVSWYLFGMMMAIVCLGAAWAFGVAAAGQERPLSLVLWLASAAFTWEAVAFVRAMVTNDRRVRRERRDGG
jgi:hypothetical protein